MKPCKINIYLSNVISIIEVSFLLRRNFILIFTTFEKNKELFFPNTRNHIAFQVVWRQNNLLAVLYAKNYVFVNYIYI